MLRKEHSIVTRTKITNLEWIETGKHSWGLCDSISNKHLWFRYDLRFFTIPGVKNLQDLFLVVIMNLGQKYKVKNSFFSCMF